MEDSTAMEEINLLGRKPVNIFTFTATAMRMSVYWSVSKSSFITF